MAVITHYERNKIIDAVLDTIYKEVGNPGYDGRWELEDLAERVVTMVLKAVEQHNAGTVAEEVSKL